MALADKLIMAGLSDTGRQRSHNEDRMSFDRESGMALVADGVGGHKAGEVASSLTVTVLAKAVKGHTGKLGPAATDSATGLSPAGEWLMGALRQANEAIHQVAKSQPQYQGMCAAAVIVLFHDNRVIIGHVGDCRLYRLRRGELTRMTEDHTLMRELVQRGHLGEAEAAASVNPHILTQALGNQPEVAPEVRESPALPEDLYLLCSDGLTDMVTDAEIQDILQAVNSLEEGTQRLVDAANARGGQDNVTVVLAQPIAPFPAAKGWLDRLFR